MLIVTIHNVHTDENDVATYDVVVMVNDRVLADYKVTGFHRPRGWAALLIEAGELGSGIEVIQESFMKYIESQDA